MQVQPQGAIRCDARTEAKVHQQAAIQCGAVYNKHNRPVGKDSVWRRAVELACVARGECRESGSHTEVESPVRGGAWKSVATRDSSGRLRFFKIFSILSKKTPTISVTYKNSHKKKKAFGVLLKQKETPKKERSTEKKKKKKRKLYGRGIEA
jgi:hypothetical protein